LNERAERHRTSSIYYQFQPAHDPNDDRLNSLRADRLWISDPALFNDPLDLRLAVKDLTYRGPFQDEARLKGALRLLLDGDDQLGLHKFYDGPLLNSIHNWAEQRISTVELLQDIERRFERFGVACFTSHLDNQLMWSHYASCHAGFCVEYSVRSMSFACENPDFLQCHVQYVSKLPELCLSEALFTPHQLLLRMLATKSTDWAYEREWRLAHLDQKHSAVEMPKHMCISALVAGLKMAPDKVNQLKHKAAELGVPAFQVRMKSGYEMSLESL
jgi:hypothetical protein